MAGISYSEKPITLEHVQEVLRRISNTDVTIRLCILRPRGLTGHARPQPTATDVYF